MENEPGHSGIRQCAVCGKYSSRSDFKENSCPRCWKWFLFNCDEYFHKDNKNICSNNCEMVGMLLSCNSCRLKKFLETTKYRCGQRQCLSCGCRTIINDKNPQCSCCRVLTKIKCTCNISTIPCSWCVNKSSSKNNNNVNVESLVVNGKKSLELPSSQALLPNFTTGPSMFGYRSKLPVIEWTEHCDTAPQTTIHIDLSLLPENLQAKAKLQVLGNCYVRIRDLSSIVQKSKKEQEKRKGKKRSRSGSLTRNEEIFANARISSQGNHGKLHKQKASKDRDSPDYSVRNVSDTRLILRLGMERHDADAESHVEASHYIESCSTNREKSAFPRKNHQVKTKFPVDRNNFAAGQGSKSDAKINGDSSERTVVDKASQTEPLPEIECLQRRITELELIIAASRSCLTPSPLGALAPEKSSIDPTMTLSTPPNSDSGSNTRNETPVKSPCVLVNRLTNDVLKHYGINRNSSVSPTEEPRPKKRPRLNSVDAEHRSFRKSDKKNGGTKKVFELFGNDSEEDIPASKDDVGTNKSQPFDFDGLDYDDEDKESPPSKNCNDESQQMNKREKTSEMDRHDKSSKGEKKEKNSEKDKRKEKERKKKENQKSKTSGIPKPSKALKEKGQKETTKSQKNQTAIVNSNKFRIPKLTAPATVGLPSLLQKNLDLALKTPTSSLLEEGMSSLTPEPEPVKNSVVKSNELPQVTSNIENTIEPLVSTSSFELTGKVAPPILCIVPKNRNNKSVNFSEQLATIRSISPRTQLHDHEQVPDDSSRENYIPTILQDLHYVPKSSPREPVKGIRPFHPPVRKIDDEKHKSLPQERGGRRFIYSSSSSSNSSDTESSEDESKEENESIFYYEKSTSQTSALTATICPMENQPISNGTSAIQQNGSVLGMSYIGQETIERACLSTTGSIASDTLSTKAQRALRTNGLIETEDTTRNISRASESEENAQIKSPERSHLSSLEDSPSPRRPTPEPVPHVSTPPKRVDAQDSEEDDSEDGDVLDLGLDDEEIFDYGYNEDEQLHEPPPLKLPANKIINKSTGILCKKDVQPTSPNTATTSNRTNVPAVEVKPSAILTSTPPTTSHPLPPRDEQPNSRGLCYSFIRTGKCAVSDHAKKKCDYNHCLDSILDHIQYLCNKKGNFIQTASRLVFAMTNVESPLNKCLFEPVGSQIVNTVIHAFLKENRPEQLPFALEMLNDPKLPLVTEFIDQIIKQIQISPLPIAKKLLTLYDRCEFNNVKISLHSFNKIIAMLVYYKMRGWDFLCRVVEFAMMHYPQSYHPTNEVLDFLFSAALDQAKLERVCHLFRDIGSQALVTLGPQRRDEVLNRLRDFGLVDWYDRYSGIVRRPIGNEMHSQFVAPQYAPNGLINQSSHDPTLPLHRAQPSMPQTTPFQPPSRPLLHTDRPQIPNLPPTGHHRPSSLAVQPAVVHRAPPPSIPPVGLYQQQPRPIRVGHPVVNAPHPSAPAAYAVRNHPETLHRPTSNWTAATPSGSHVPSIPLSPTRAVPLPETKQAPPFIPLEVPKPSQSLALNLFEPESPEVEPVFTEDSEPEEGPNVVVEPSYGTEDELLAEFKKSNFDAVTRLFLQYYSGRKSCQMLTNLVRIMKTNPLYSPEENQKLSPGDIFIHIIRRACENAYFGYSGGATTLEHRHQQALSDLSYFVLVHSMEIFNTSDEDEKITQRENVKQFVKMVRLFELSCEDSINDPELLLFLAECFVQVDYTKEEEEDFFEVTADDIWRSINFAIDFHKVVAKMPVNGFSPNLVAKDLALSTAILQVIHSLREIDEFEPFVNGILGAMSDYQDASLKNKSRFKAILPCA
ncbi:uncharacterized protein LOC130685209 isoform X2 [Daphnia carinata]|uniref:uncharacterized protein LOC130685209 isoform X2 n=1 Tax=Daphnia carinata TaxID=120202 RepID=UPI00257AC0B3|nr:uncharacterized protein LOC130685209 isoform X2 [Daphnia carinata]